MKVYPPNFSGRDWKTMINLLKEEKGLGLVWAGPKQ